MQLSSRVARSLLVPLLLAAGLAVAGCGGGGSDEDGGDGGGGDLPKVKQNGVVSAPDVAAANELCQRYQKKKPKLVTQLRVKVKGSPSVLCIVQ